MQVGSSSAFPQSVAIYASVIPTDPTSLSPQAGTALPPVQPPSQGAATQNQPAPNSVVYTPQSLQAASRAYDSGGAKSNQSGGDPAATSTDAAPSEESSPSQSGQLTAAESDQVQKLAARDREVRAHELAHSSVGGQYAGATSYTLQRGPNGVAYAIGGEVSIDLSPVANDPAATIRKMQQVRSAALAPADPSSQDWAVAAAAARIAVEARSELAQQQARAARQPADATASAASADNSAATAQDNARTGASTAAGTTTASAANGKQDGNNSQAEGKSKDSAANSSPPLTSIQTYQELIALGLRKNSAYQFNAIA